MNIEAKILLQVTNVATALKAYNTKASGARTESKTPSPVIDKITLSDVAKDILSGKAKPEKTSKSASQSLTVVDTVQMRREAKEAQRKMRSEKKGRLTARFKALVEQLKIMKKLYSANPKQMAKYLAGMAQELRKILKEYAAINKEAKAEAKDSGASSAALSTPNLTVSEAGSASKDQEINAAQEKDVSVSQASPAPEAAPPPEATSLTETEAAKEAREDKEYAVMEAKGDLSFAKEVRGFVQELRKLLQETKIKNFFNQDNPNEKEKLFKETLEVFKKLEDELKDFIKDVEKDIPPPERSVEDADVGDEGTFVDAEAPSEPAMAAAETVA